MTYTVLGINPGHNGSVALIENGVLTYYIEEDRLSRLKNDGNPFRGMMQFLLSKPIDELVIGGTSATYDKLPWNNEDSYAALARKCIPNIKITYLGDLHHLGHAAGAFYNSGFETAAAVIIDGAGSIHTEEVGNASVSGYETETIYACAYPNEFDAMYKHYSTGSYRGVYSDTGIQDFDSATTITKAYEAVSDYLGFGFIEAGKTMGLAPYGKSDANIPDIFINGMINKNLFIPAYPGGAYIDDEANPYLKKFNTASDWHYNFDLVTDQELNLAFEIQSAAEQYLFKLVEKAIDITGETNVVISGGFALNCVANYKLIKKFPNIKFFIDPIAHDGGTAIGIAKYAWYKHTQDYLKSPLSSLYLGLDPSYSQLDIFKQQLSHCDFTTVTHKDVAKIINAGEIVALFQGPAEGGPRALGNRSILFDPRRADGKDIVNAVKKREWFRPFAGSVLADCASDWFDMGSLSESPFMMYAVDVLPEKIDIIPAITHVDNTCRVQTVTLENNEIYFKLIKEFYKLTGVPILFNTSFNLAGEPLVDSLYDALTTLVNSEIKYLFLADINTLVSKV